ncbi:MAG: prenyltransferase/squalene oxidase repeat-containing protein [Planctomycetaceae bacterium]
MNRSNERTGLEPLSCRRTFLRSAAALGWLAWSQPIAGGTSPAPTAMPTNLKTFLESWRRDDGGYGFADMPIGHLTPSYAAAGCYQLFGERPPDAARLARFIRENHPFELKKLEREMHVFEHQQLLALQWLGEDVSQFEADVAQWHGPTEYPKQYEQDGNPVFEYEVMAILCRQRLGMSRDEVSPRLIEYVLNRRRSNGSFNNTPASDGSDGHVISTWLGIQATAETDWTSELKAKAAQWLRACQRPEGGFTWQPNPVVAGVQDVAYTRAAIEALHAIGHPLSDSAAGVNWLLTLRGADGGFGPKPNWPSNPVATFDALAALSRLDALSSIHQPLPDREHVSAARVKDSLKVYSVQIEAHGTGSPSDAVGLAKELKIDLWGAKNARPQWITEAQRIADSRGVPVRFFVANEEYGTYVRIPGLGTYSHTSDIQASPQASIGPSLATQDPVTWDEYRKRRWAPLNQTGGTVIWQFNENELFTRLHLDDSVERGGYAAISTFHFGNPDFANSEPFLMQYQGMIPYVALIDAHGPEPWWFGDQLAGMRTLFLAEQPTWEQFVVALKNKWVATVRHDAVSRQQTWWRGGDPAATRFILSRLDDYRWWGDRPPVVRPWASLVHIPAGNRWELGSLDDADTFRLRLRWDNTTQGQPKTQRTELIRLLVDGQVVKPKHELIKKNGKLVDDRYVYAIPADQKPLSAVAELRRLDNGQSVEVVWDATA